MNADERRLEEISHRIIGSAYRVSDGPGCGFLENAYENALLHEIEEAVLIKIKSAKAIDSVNLAQCLNYLKATGLTLALLLNFGVPKVQVQRVVNNL